MIDWYQEVVARQEDLLAAVERLLRIPSVRDDTLASSDCPVGPGPKAALDEFLVMADEAGFAWTSFGNLVAHIDWGQGEELFGLLGHVDVVPAGDGWISDPFVPTYQDGKLFARGALDDKGPLVAAFFAMTLLKEKGIVPKKTVRLIVGTDEESDWKCLQHYQTVCELPQTGFVPDAYFPIVNGEKGNASLVLTVSDQTVCSSDLSLVYFKAGLRENMVPDKAEALISGIDLEVLKLAFTKFLSRERGITGQVEMTETGLRLLVRGQSAHGSKPEAGVNAATYLAHFLAAWPFNRQAANHLVVLLDKILHLDYFGQAMGLAYSDHRMGRLTLNPGIISYQDGQPGRVLINIRYPKGVDLESAQQLIPQKLAGTGVTFLLQPKQAPHYVPQEHPLVKTLLTIYHEQTDLPAYERVIGGATYARLMPEGVAFGALFPDAIDTMHQANEHIDVEQLLLTCAMYAKALEALAC